MIEPGIGRIVHFYPAGHAPGALPHAAMVVGISSERVINLAIWDHEGHHYHGTDVQLLQDDDVPTEGHCHAEWMPFQKGQAAKTEALQAQLAAPPAPAPQPAPQPQQQAAPVQQEPAPAPQVAQPANQAPPAPQPQAAPAADPAPGQAAQA